MKLLETVEGHVGDIDSWPSYILRYIFSDHPSPVASARLKKVIALFFGNDVPCKMACRFYHACNGPASGFVGEQFREWCSVWQRSQNKIHMAMRLRKQVYINSSLYNQCEPVLSEPPVTDFSIDNTYCRRLILGVLENVKPLDGWKNKSCVCVCQFFSTSAGLWHRYRAFEHVEKTGHLKIKLCTDYVLLFAEPFPRHEYRSRQTSITFSTQDSRHDKLLHEYRSRQTSLTFSPQDL
jgi:hypothetical protein